MTTAIAQAVSAALLHFVWQGVLVASLLWIALFLLRNRSANTRYVVSCGALGIMALLPVITACLFFEAPRAVEASGRVAESATETAAVAVIHAVASSPWLATVQMWAVPAWSIGVLLFSLRLVWGCRQVSAMRRRGESADAAVASMVERLGSRLGIARSVRVLTTASAESPSVMGWVRPVILLPSATLLGLTMPQLEAVLAHELAHVRRHDYLANMLQMLVETYLFYHPAVWWTSQRIRQERELCCDDLAVEACGDALCYARALTKLERLRVVAPEMAMAGTGGALMYRIQRLVNGRNEGYGPGKLPGILALCLGLACFALNVKWARGQEQEGTSLKAGSYVFLTRFDAARDGAGVTVDLGGAAVMHRTSISYPEAAIEKQVEGTLTIDAVLDGQGDVVDARIVSGPVELRKEALREVLEWHFVPQSGVTLRQVNITYQLAAARSERREEPALARVTADAHISEDAQEVPPGARLELRSERDPVVTRNGENGFAITLDRANTVEAGSAHVQRDDLEPHAVPDGVVGGIAGRFLEGRLARINVMGLPEQARQQLLANLPVKLGDTVNAEVVSKVEAVVKKFDIHLECNVALLENGDVAFEVRPPNMPVVYTLRQK